jgi:protein gp37
MGKTQISWTDYSWNIARGCSKVDSDCKFCYMYRDSFDGHRYNPFEIVKTKTVFTMPLKIKEPAKIFTCSLTDFFHSGCDSFRNEAWDIIRKCPQHTFQILTKRPERITENTPADLLQAKNIWYGTSVGSEAGKHRINDLLKVDCNTRFISFEPLHERINLDLSSADLAKIHWAIIGGESGNDTGKYRYRPCEIQWMEEIMNSFPAETAIFVKQMGTHLAKEMKMSDRHGTNIDEFPIFLQIREFPNL